VPRRVRKQLDSNESTEAGQPRELASFRTEHAWVLLGEPGAGKSTVLEDEAKQAGGQYLRIDEFIELDVDPSWQDKTLFLDGLDEVRASGAGSSTLLRVRKQLNRLGKPAFRIACRAADWYGATDSEDLKAATLHGKITILSLEPLNEDDILAILQQNAGIADPAQFVSTAKARGVADLLANPQTLEMLTKAVKGNEEAWPTSRDKTYRLACEKLAEEHNQKHHRAKQDEPVSVHQILDAAGQLFAVMLLADRNGIATDATGASERFPVLEDFDPPEQRAARRAIGSKLFRPDGVEERLQPAHRSVAEYLAARWLGQQIDAKCLPLPRLLTLLLGVDGGVVAGLRGLFAWLAVHCQSARSRLIKADPLTVVIYGDVKPMSADNKRAILQGLRREAEKFSGFRGRVGEAHRFGALADPALFEDFCKILQAPERDDASQTMVGCVLDMLDGSGLKEFAPVVLEIVRDDSYRSWFRSKALEVWVKCASPGDVISLLEDIHQGRVKDAEGALAGLLLMDLYPGHLRAEALLRFLRIPDHNSFIGDYHFFWTRHLPENIRDDNLPGFLDGLTGRTDFRLETTFSSFLAGRMVVRGLEKLGTAVSAERLYAWLGITSDEFGHVAMDQDSRSRIAAWFKAHPERYKDALAVCYQHSQSAENIYQCLNAKLERLNDIPKPDDIGLWHFTQATQATRDELTQEHLQQAINSLQYGKGSIGLSLEDIESWAEKDLKRTALLQPLLSWKITASRTQQTRNIIDRLKNNAELKRQRLKQFSPLLSDIENGSASAHVMNDLARLWRGELSGASGETAQTRFSNFIEEGTELFAKAEAGFRLCPERNDLPEPQVIIDLYLDQKEPWIGLPCRIGMDLRWQTGVGQIDSLSDAVLDRMLTLWLTRGSGLADWVKHLSKERPPLFSQAVVRYAKSMFKAGRDVIDGIQVLEDPDGEEAGKLALPQLLEIFPARALEGQTNTLGRLIKLALQLVPEELIRVSEKKLQVVRKLNVPQAVHWHAAAMLLDSAKAEALWAFIGNTAKRCDCLADFFGGRFGFSQLDLDLPATVLGKLIELMTPHAELEWPTTDDSFSAAHLRGDQIRRYIDQLAATDNEGVADEIERLLALPSLNKLKWNLENARHQQALRRRESSFSFLSPREVAKVLTNGAPASRADLAALVLDHLDQIADEIRNDNDDGYIAFWNGDNQALAKPRIENHCRDPLLTRLKLHLKPLGISCEPEMDNSGDTRADIEVLYRNEFKLPIEIKRDSNDSLWTAMRQQLIAQYTTAPLAGGFGIYLVLWFGRGGVYKANDGGKKPTSPQELQARLTEQLDVTEQDRVFVRVLDVSW